MTRWRVGDIGREGDVMIYTNEHKTLILGREYRFQFKCEGFVAEDRRSGSGEPWQAVTLPSMVQHLKLIALRRELERDRLLQIADGWDGPESKAPHHPLVLRAVALLRGLVDDGYPVPSLYPTPDGGVRAEWDPRTQAHDVSVDFEAERIYYHALDLADDEVDDGRHTWAEAQQVADALRRLLIRSPLAGGRPIVAVKFTSPIPTDGDPASADVYDCPGCGGIGILTLDACEERPCLDCDGTGRDPLRARTR